MRVILKVIFEYFWKRIGAGVDLEEGCEGDHVEKNNYLRGD